MTKIFGPSTIYKSVMKNFHRENITKRSWLDVGEIPKSLLSLLSFDDIWKT